MVLFEPHGPLVNANRGTDRVRRPPQAAAGGLQVPARLQRDRGGAAGALRPPAGRGAARLQQREAPRRLQGAARLRQLQGPHRAGPGALPAARGSRRRRSTTPRSPPATVGKHVAPHATEVAALWAVLTRLKKPLPERYPADVRELVEDLTPLEKLQLYEDGTPPDRLSLAQARELRKWLPALYEESDAYPNYEGRTGASAREIKTALLNAAQNPDRPCLSPLAVLEELSDLCRDKSVYEFLQQEVVDGYHDHEEFVRTVESALPRVRRRRGAGVDAPGLRRAVHLALRAVHPARSPLGEEREDAQPGDRRDGAAGRASGWGRWRPSSCPAATTRASSAAASSGRSAPTSWRTPRRRWTTGGSSPTCSAVCGSTSSTSASGPSAAARRTSSRRLSDEKAGLERPGARASQADPGGDAGALRLLRGLRQGRDPLPGPQALRQLSEGSVGGRWLSLPPWPGARGTSTSWTSPGRWRPGPPATASTSARSWCVTGPSSPPATTAASGGCPTATRWGT